MEASRSGAIELGVVLRFIDIATDALAGAREEIDALNVYPVPDGDTGTNMYLTVSAAREAIREAFRRASGNDPDVVRHTSLRACSRGALLGARGNSGVILSEMLGAVCRRIDAADRAESSARVMADALRAASDAAYAAVGTPVEGTILTVARAAADAAAESLAGGAARSGQIFTAAARAAREALARTPEQLEALRAAGVVDAGGRGLSVVLDAAETALTGRRPVPVTAPIGTHTIPIPVPAAAAGDLTPDGPAYEVMYLLDADEQRIPVLRTALGALGDSLVVVGDEGLWNVHVHVDDVGAAIEAGIEAGRPHRVRVTHFAEQIAAAARRDHPGAERAGRRIVTVAAGPGLAEPFGQAGAVEGGGATPLHRRAARRHHRVRRGRGRRAAQRQGLRAGRPDRGAHRRGRPRGAGRGDPHPRAGPGPGRPGRPRARPEPRPGRPRDDRDRPPRPARRRDRRRAPGHHDGRPLRARGRARRGRRRLRRRRGRPVRRRDAGRRAAARRWRRARHRLAGDQGPPELAARLAAWVEEQHPHVDVVVYDGGQERYPLLVSVE